jgi:hypothetical protein
LELRAVILRLTGTPTKTCCPGFARSTAKLKTVLDATVKLVVVVNVPPGVVTEIGPVVAPVGTVAVIWVAEFTTTLVAVIPLNLTTVVPIKPEPEITTEVPTCPEVGVKDVIVGASGVLVNAKLALVIPGLPTTDDSTMKFPGALFAVNVVDAASPVTPVIAMMVC